MRAIIICKQINKNNTNKVLERNIERNQEFGMYLTFLKNS